MGGSVRCRWLHPRGAVGKASEGRVGRKGRVDLESLGIGPRGELGEMRDLVHALAVADVGPRKGRVLVFGRHVGFGRQGERGGLCGR